MSTFLTRSAATDAGRPPRSPGRPASAAGQTSLLYICGSLPLFLGGELPHPARTIRRGLTAAWLVTAVVVTAAAAPAFTRAPIPGMAVAARFAGNGFALAVGLGVAVSIALINPDRIYSFLIKPSLVALWLSQLIVFAVYPRFARRQHDRRLPAWALTVVATAFALFSLWVTIQHSAT